LVFGYLNYQRLKFELISYKSISIGDILTNKEI
jgi:hypothetical protein